MNALELFREHRGELVAKWVDSVFATYPLDAVGFLRTREDQFCNPVGDITTTSLGRMYDAVAGEHVVAELLQDALTRFVKVRAVQDFTPSQALGVIYLLKPAMRAKLWPLFSEGGLEAEYLEAESRLDTLALMAMDVYMASHKTIAEERIKEIRNQHAQLVRWAQKAGAGPGKI